MSFKKRQADELYFAYVYGIAREKMKNDQERPKISPEHARSPITGSLWLKYEFVLGKCNNFPCKSALIKHPHNECCRRGRLFGVLSEEMEK